MALQRKRKKERNKKNDEIIFALSNAHRWYVCGGSQHSRTHYNVLNLSTYIYNRFQSQPKFHRKSINIRACVCSNNFMTCVAATIRWRRLRQLRRIQNPVSRNIQQILRSLLSTLQSTLYRNRTGWFSNHNNNNHFSFGCGSPPIGAKTIPKVHDCGGCTRANKRWSCWIIFIYPETFSLRSCSLNFICVNCVTHITVYV